MTRAATAFGFDVGGQSIKAVLMSDDGEVLASATSRTDAQVSPADLAGMIAALRDELVRQAGAAEGCSAGVGIAGVLDRHGAVRGSPHLPLLIGSQIGQAISARLGTRAVVHNDADCAAMAESWRGAADGVADFLLIAIGTGVGSGLVLGGRLRAGDSNYGCEFGHMTIVHRGRLCGCGHRGCLEAYISETAASRLVGEAEETLRSRVAQRRQARGGGAAQAVFELGRDGDAAAERIAAQMVDSLGAAIGSAVNVLDLTTIVLGGGIAPGVLARLDSLREAAAETLFARPVSDLDIVAAARGPLAGAIGAARLGMPGR